MENNINNKQEKRRFSLEEDFMKIKTLNDLIYGKLQSLSYINKDNERFIYSSDFKQEKIAQELNIPIATFKRNFKALQVAGFVQKGKVKDLKGKQVSCYYLPYNVNEKYKLIPTTTLDYLLQINTQNVIKVYLYLLDKYEWKNKNNAQYIFTKAELIEAIGYSTKNNQGSYDLINYILTSLKNNGLINYEEFYYNNKIPNIKLINVNTVVKGLEKQTQKVELQEQSMLEQTLAQSSSNDGAFNF